MHRQRKIPCWNVDVSAAAFTGVLRIRVRTSSRGTDKWGQRGSHRIEKQGCVQETDFRRRAEGALGKVRSKYVMFPLEYAYQKGRARLFRAEYFPQFQAIEEAALVLLSSTYAIQSLPGPDTNARTSNWRMSATVHTGTNKFIAQNSTVPLLPRKFFLYCGGRKRLSQGRHGVSRVLRGVAGGSRVRRRSRHLEGETPVVFADIAMHTGVAGL